MRRHPAPRLPLAAGGWTLVEVVVVLAIVGLLAATAVPSQRASVERARRIDATAALLRLQVAQEQFRMRHGAYASTLASLTGAAGARSPEGLYSLDLRGAGADTVTLVAVARADGPQARDRDCAEITLQLNQGVADPGPNGRCWNS